MSISLMVKFCTKFTAAQIIEAFEAFAGKEPSTRSFAGRSNEVTVHWRNILLRRKGTHYSFNLQRRYYCAQLVGNEGDENQLGVIATFMKARLASLVPMESP